MLKNIQPNYFKKQRILRCSWISTEIVIFLTLPEENMLWNLSQVLNGNFLCVRSGTPKPFLPLQKRGLQCGWSESYSLTEMSGRQIGGSKIILSFFFLSYAFVHCLKIPYYSNSANVNFKAYFQSRCINMTRMKICFEFQLSLIVIIFF